MAYETSKLVKTKGGQRTRKVYLAKWKQDGKEREKSFKTLREARSYAAEMSAKHESGDLTSLETKQRSRVLFEDVADDYIEFISKPSAGRDALEAQTIRTYRHYMDKYVKAFFGFRGMSIGAVDHYVMEELREWAVARTRTLAAAREVLRLAKAVLQHAVNRRLIEDVPGRDVTIRRTRSERIDERVYRDERVYTHSQVVALLRAADSLAADKQKQRRAAWQKYRALLYFIAYTGTRISEARGLSREDFDRPKGYVRIKVRASEAGEIGRPKSADGVRNIPIPPALMEPMKQVLDSHSRSLIFSTENGTPINYQNLWNRMWVVLIERANELESAAAGENGADDRVEVPRLGFHALRHWYVSRLIEAGANLKQLQVWSGHHSPAFTLSQYGHLLDDRDGVADVMAKVAV